MTWLDPVTLTSEHVVLKPLQRSHETDLIDAARDGELWNLWFTNVPTETYMGMEIDRRLALQTAGSMLPFAVIDPSNGRAVGITTYMAADAVNHRLEIGYTWYRNSVQKTPLNTSCKLLLLTHAFETLDCIAVEFRTHFFNHDSRRSIERLGAKLDGVLRSHLISRNSTLRDTCVYSVIAAEWPTVKANLIWQLSRPRG